MRNWLKVVLTISVVMLFLLNVSFTYEDAKIIHSQDRVLNKNFKIQRQNLENEISVIKQATNKNVIHNKAETTVFFEDFEGWGVFPDDSWVYENNATYDEASLSTDAYSGSQCIEFNSYNASGASDDWLITKAVSIPATTKKGNVLVATLKFFEKTSFGSETVEIKVLNQQTSGATSIETISSETYSGSTYEQQSVDLSSYIGQTIYIAFVYQSNYSYYWYLDDVEVTVDDTDNNPPELTYTPSLNTYNQDPVTISAEASDPSGIDGTPVLHYDANDDDVYEGSVNMTAVKGAYTGNIPAQAYGTKVKYKFEATDASAQSNTAETDPDSFMVETPTDLYYHNGDGTSDGNYWFGSGTVFGPIMEFELTGDTRINSLSFYSTSTGNDAEIVIYDNSKDKLSLIYSQTVTIQNSGWNTYSVDLETTGDVLAGVIGDGNSYFGYDDGYDYGTTYFYFGGDGSINPAADGGLPAGSWLVNLNVSHIFDHDIAVSSIEMPAEIHTGDEAEFLVEVKNAGTNKETNVVVNFNVAKSNLKATIPELQPGASQMLSFVWTATAGTDLTATVDAVLGGDENPANNTMTSATFDVEDYTLPTPESLNEGFEGTFPPDGWTVVNNGDANAWVQYSTTPHTGTYCAAIGYSLSAHDDWLITPKLNITTTKSTISFWAKNGSSSWLEQFNVKVSTTGTDPSDFVDVIASNEEPSTTWTEYTYDLSSYNSQEIYFAIQAISANQLRLYVDDFTGPEIAGSGPSTDELSLEKVNRPDLGNDYTTNTNIPFTVDLRNRGTNALTNVEIMIEATRESSLKGEKDNIKADYTFLSDVIASLPSEAADAAEFTSDPVNINTAGIYAVKVSNNINSNEMNFKMAVYQRQAANGVYTALFGESFELESFPPEFQYSGQFGELVMDGNFGDKAIATAGEGYLITPMINLPAGKLYRLTFYAKTNGLTNFSVKASNNGKDLDDFDINLLGDTPFNSAVYGQFKVDLKDGAAYLADEDLYLGIFTDGNMTIDDIVVTEIIPNDMEALSIAAPDDILALAAGLPLQFKGTVANIGTDNLQNKTVALEIYDNTKTLVTTIEKTININSGQEVTLVFDPWTPTAAGSYDFILRTPDDMNNANNTAEASFEIYEEGTLLFEDFENVAADEDLPDGWTTQYVDISGTMYPGWKATTATPGANDFALQLVYGGGEYFLVTPNIFIPQGEYYRLTFWYMADGAKKLDSKFRGKGKAGEFMKIKISTDANADNFDAYTEIAGEVEEVAGDWKKFVVDLSEYTNQYMYIAVASDWGDYQWRLDDVYVGPSPDADVGVESVTYSAAVQYHTPVNIIANVHNYGKVSQTCDVYYMTDESKASGSTTVTVAPGATVEAAMEWIPDVDPGEEVNITVNTELSGDAETSNDTLNVSVTVGAAGEVFGFFDDFNDEDISNWTITNDGTGLPWDVGTVRTLSSPGLYCDSDAQGSGNTQDTWAISPMIDLSSKTNVKLAYWMYYYKYSSDVDASVNYRINGGSWNEIDNYTGVTNQGNKEYDLTEELAGQSNVQIGFHYASSWGYYWLIDDVLLGDRIVNSDLEIKDIKQPANIVGVNQLINMSTMLYNVGTDDQKLNKLMVRENIPVLFQIKNNVGDTLYSETVTVASLNAGDSTEVITSTGWTVPDSLDAVYTVCAEIQYETDQNPENNSAEKDITAKHYIDAEVTEISSPKVVLNNSAYEVTALVTNNGAAAIPSGSVVTLTITDPSKAVVHTETAMTPDINYGETEAITFYNWITGPHIGWEYVLETAIDLANDEVDTNDSAELELTSQKEIPALSETFDSGVFPPEGWTVINNNGDFYTWTQSDVGHTDEYSAFINYTSQAHDDWLVTPQVAITNSKSSISFWAKKSSASYDDRFNVKLSTASNDVADFTVVLDSEVEASADWTEYTYDMSAYAGQSVYFAVQAISNNQYNIYVDDFTGGTPTNPACLAPANFTAINSGYGTSANLTWDKNVEEDLVSYRVYYEPAAKGKSKTKAAQYVDVDKNVEFPYLLEGLTEDVTYNCWVKAYDGHSFSPESETQTFTAEVVPPSEAVTNLQAAEPTEADQGTTSVLTWTKSADDASKGAEVVSYRIFRSISEDTGYSLIGTVDPGIETYTDNTMSPMITYYYKVSAFNGYIDAFAGPVEIMVHDEIAPAGPSGLAVVDYPNDQGGKLILNWELSLDDPNAKNSEVLRKTKSVRKAAVKAGANDVQAYNIYRSETSESYGTVYAAVEAGINTYTDTDAPIGTTYYYTVKAVDSENLSDASNEASGASVDNIAPAKPRNLLAKDTPFDEGTSLTLNWTASLNDPVYVNSNNGMDVYDVTGYFIYRSKGDNSNFVKIDEVALANGESYTYIDNLEETDAEFDTLDVGVTEYYYYVKAHDTNLENPSLASNESFAVPKNNLLAPMPPAYLTAADKPNDQGGAIKLQWPLSADDNNTALGTVSEYVIYRKEAGVKNAEYTELARVPKQTKIYWDEDENLVIGGAYSYKVTATNAAGFESDMETAPGDDAVNIDNIAPMASSALWAVDKAQDNGGALEVHWLLSMDDPNYKIARKDSKSLKDSKFYVGAGDVAVYKLFRRVGFSGDFEIIAEFEPGVSSYEDTDVVTGTTYYYKIKAYDLMNSSNYSNTSSAKPIDNIAPDAPANLNAELVDVKDMNTVLLTWDAAAAEDVQSYHIYRAVSLNGSFVHIAQVTAEYTEYYDENSITGDIYYKVRAFDGSSYSNYSNIAAAVTPGETDEIPPMAPSGFTVSDNINKVRLNWKLSADDPYNYMTKGGYDDVVKYEIEKYDSEGTLLNTFMVPRGIATYTDYNVEVNAEYTYSIRAYDGTNYSEEAPEVTVTVEPFMPEPPTNVRAQINGDILFLRWSLSTDEANGSISKYNVYLADEAEEFTDPEASVDAGIGVWIAELEPGTYKAGVQSVDIYGNKSEIVEIVFSITDKNIVKASPNPFNPTTTISYAVAGPSKVSLAIYNASGQLVKVLASETQNAGEYRYVWNGDDMSGNKVSSGMYFYKLQINEETVIKKLLLMK